MPRSKMNQTGCLTLQPPRMTPEGLEVRPRIGISLGRSARAVLNYSIINTLVVNTSCWGSCRAGDTCVSDRGRSHSSSHIACYVTTGLPSYMSQGHVSRALPRVPGRRPVLLPRCGHQPKSQHGPR